MERVLVPLKIGKDITIYDEGNILSKMFPCFVLLFGRGGGVNRRLASYVIIL